MKKNNIADVRGEFFLGFLYKIGIFTVIYIAIIVLGYTFSRQTYTVLKAIFGKDVYTIFNIKEQIMIITYLIVFIIIAIIAIWRSFDNINTMYESIDNVFSKDEKLIELPKQLKDVETKLNTIKYATIKNEQLAKDAEQRKNDLVVYLAHDLKTPLTSVIGYLTLLSESASDMTIEQRSKYIGIALDKAERLESLINEFFEITRFNLQNIILEKNTINLSLMIQQISDEMYPVIAEKNLRFQLDFTDDITVKGDSNKLARVFDNLVKNAINYSFENSVITISIEKTIHKVCIRIRNMGTAIPSHKLENIFEKFYRLDSARTSKTGGAGLGLAIAKEIVELHNGKITAISNEEYTEFVIMLPV